MIATRGIHRRGRGAIGIAFGLLLLLCERAVGDDGDAHRAKETLIFQDNFEDLDPSVWKHEITMSGGGNWEFQVGAGECGSNVWLALVLPVLRCIVVLFSLFYTCAHVLKCAWS